MLTDELEANWSEEDQKYIDLLPAWFTERMLSDTWSFGLLMITGDVIAIECITSITQDATGNLWLNATLETDDNSKGQVDNVAGHKLLLAPTSRASVSINASHVVAAFELADT